MGFWSLLWPSSNAVAGRFYFFPHPSQQPPTTTVATHHHGTKQRNNNKDVTTTGGDDTTDSSSSNQQQHQFPPHEVGFDDLCHQLETNDPKLQHVVLGNLNNVNAVMLGQCLTNNTVVTNLTIDFQFLHRFTGSIFCFLDFMEFSPSLLTIALINADLTDAKVCSTLLVLLPAISRNGKIQNFCLQAKQGLIFYDVFGAFWHTIVMALFFGGPPSATLLQTAVTVSMCQCQSLSMLQLVRLPEGFLCQLLPDLAKVTALTKVTLVPKYYSIATFHALAELIGKSTTLATIGLSGYRLTEKRFAPLTDALLSSSSKCQGLELSDCRLDRGASQRLQRLFTGKAPHMQQLVLQGSVTFDKDAAVILISMLTSPLSTVKELDLTHFPLRKPQIIKLLSALSINDDDNDDNDEDDGDNVAENNDKNDGLDDDGEEENSASAPPSIAPTLERLLLHSITSEVEIDAVKRVAASLPKLKFLHIETLTAPTSEHIDDLRSALQCNINMEQCSWNGKIHILQQPPPPMMMMSNDAARNSNTRPLNPAMIDRTAALKRKESLRRLLSDDEIDAINAKDEYLQMRNNNNNASASNSSSNNNDTIGHSIPPNRSHIVVDEDGESGSNWEDLDTTTTTITTNNHNNQNASESTDGLKDSTKGSVESAANRHALGSQVKNLLKE